MFFFSHVYKNAFLSGFSYVFWIEPIAAFINVAIDLGK